MVFNYYCNKQYNKQDKIKIHNFQTISPERTASRLFYISSSVPPFRSGLFDFFSCTNITILWLQNNINRAAVWVYLCVVYLNKNQVQ